MNQAQTQHENHRDGRMSEQLVRSAGDGTMRFEDEVPGDASCCGGDEVAERVPAVDQA